MSVFPISAETVAITTTDAGQISSSVTALEGGGDVVAWVTTDPGLSSFEVDAQLCDASGNALGGEVLANTNLRNSHAQAD